MNKIRDRVKLKQKSWDPAMDSSHFRQNEHQTRAGCRVLQKTNQPATDSIDAFHGLFRWPLAASWGGYNPSNGLKGSHLVEARNLLDRLTADNFIWRPYEDHRITVIVHPSILEDQHTKLWRAVTSLIYFAQVKWHQADRVVGQLGGRQ
ncbi:hypothetical protein PIB30_086741 [Stylosanthes scabra]|uniref:Aminotransferase-like plant mobile domain-containing protein n=1 Tax=Stylosanthes scabra TaxID=79078 RepID=A0ABU6RTW4_9FABA|nr:hypothetical protein [Stylosanthes scabra]